MIRSEESVTQGGPDPAAQLVALLDRADELLHRDPREAEQLARRCDERQRGRLCCRSGHGLATNGRRWPPSGASSTSRSS